MTVQTNATSIKPKHREAIIQSLRAGVVPRVGQQHIQVGRHDEVKALVADIDRIAEGGSSIRFIIGEYGSGKTFFLNLIRSIALERNLVAINADLSPDRRLQATGGQARSLYAELMRNISTRSKPDGGAMARDGRIEIVQRAIGVEHAELDAGQCGGGHVLGYSHVRRRRSNHRSHISSPSRTPRRGGGAVIRDGGVMGTTTGAHDPSVSVRR